MSDCSRLNKKLKERFHGRVTASEERGCLVLRGELDDWQEIVLAGRMSVRKNRYLGLVNDIVYTGGTVPPMRTPALQDTALDGQSPDVLIIGGGVVGCAIARELTRWKLSVLLCEKEHDLACHASSRNDGMVHPGVDLLPGQVKRRYNLRGNRMYDQITAELDVPFHRCGQYLCFQKLPLAVASFFAPVYFRLIGIPCRFLGRRSLKRKEPALTGRIKTALFFPTAGSVCPYGLTIAYGENAVDNGARISLDTAVTAMTVTDGTIRSVSTNRGTLYPKVVVNAAGVFSEDVAQMAGDRFFSIHPRKGTNSILDHKSARRIMTIVSSYGTSSTKRMHTKGGGLVHTADDNILVGPDAHETYEKENFSTEAQSIRDTFTKQRLTDPKLTEREIITYFTGIRAATYEEDFVITKGKFTKNIVHAAGIQSPGLTAAPAIAVDVAQMTVELLEGEKKVERNPAFSPARKAIVHAAALSDEERGELIASDPAYGEIVCRCEEVSRGEIRDALHRSVPCDTLDGVKRRVRPGMGRCQGGFCGPLVLQIIVEETGKALNEIVKGEAGGNILLTPVKEANDGHGIL